MIKEKVRYGAISIFASRTFQFSMLTFIVAVLSMPEVLTLIPSNWMPHVLAAVAVINMFLRYITVRPVSFIKPGGMEMVEVKKLTEPPGTKGSTD